MDKYHCDECYTISRPEFVATAKKKWGNRENITCNTIAGRSSLKWLTEHCYKKPSLTFDGHITLLPRDDEQYFIKVDKAGANAVLRYFAEDPFDIDATIYIVDESRIGKNDNMYHDDFSSFRMYVMGQPITDRRDVNVWTARYIGFQLSTGPKDKTREAWMDFLTHYKLALYDTMFIYLCNWGFMKINDLDFKGE